MTTDAWREVERIYHAALARPVSERAAFVASACAGDAAVQREVESLLALAGDASAFLETPAAAVAAADLARERFPAGRQLGSYVIRGPLGAGGMGEVYRAHDVKLGREVALKILPEQWLADPERRSRLDREARLLAALNHPHIAAIYGVEDVDAAGVRALVLELVEGETLAERLRGRRALPLAEALAIAQQIADALDAAHERGIVHRDLKPANIKITPDGVVKVLDFGLAKAGGAEGDLSNSPTMTIGGTQEGMILGTAAYMSPEQARGKPVDKRADIWAFGCVLFEMLTGQAPFGGETTSDIIAAILEREPEWSRLPGSTPPAIQQLLHRCLQKDPQRRLRDIGDARLELESPAGVASRSRRPLTQSLLPWAAVALLATMTLALAILDVRPASFEQKTIALSLTAPENTTFDALVMSPDGRQVAFTTADAAGQTQLWVRPLDRATPSVLAGTAGASFPFWSPDGRWLGFFAEGKLHKVDVSGGRPQALADAPSGRGGSWGRDGVIVFAPSPTGPLYQVSTAGGEPRAVTSINPSREEDSHRWPQLLPDGRRFLYFVRSGLTETRGTYVGSLDSLETARLLGGESIGAYAESPSGQAHLLFLRNQVLMAQSFDQGTLRTTDDAFPLAQPVRSVAGLYRARFSVSVTGGVLVYEAGGSDRELSWFDRRGNRLGIVGVPGAYFSLDLSPDGQSVVVDREDQTGDRDIWLLDVARGASSRLTGRSAINTSPVWSPDGNRIIFMSTRDGVWNLYRRSSSDAGKDELLLETSRNKWPTSWSRDGSFLAYHELHAKTQWDLWVLPLERKEAPYPLLQTEFDEQWGRFSPDGKWIAYQSNETGRDEVYVRAFSPDRSPTGARWQVSTDGGVEPRWRADGTELFYLARDGRLMAVEVKAQIAFEAGVPHALFLTRALSGPFTRYAVAPGGERFLVNSEAKDRMPPTVVVNWDAKAPEKPTP